METKKTYYDNGNIKEEYQVNKDGKPHGTRKLYHENGQLRTEAEFINGIQNDGNIVSYHENGTKARSVILKDGSFQGEFFQWHTNGVLSCQGTYKDGNIIEKKLLGEDEIKVNWLQDIGPIYSEWAGDDIDSNGRVFRHFPKSKDDGEYICYYCSIEEAVFVINNIMNLNGGKSAYKKIERDGFGYCFNGYLFQLGYLIPDDDVNGIAIVDLSRHPKAEVTSFGDDIEVLYGIHEDSKKINSMIDGLNAIVYNFGEMKSGGGQLYFTSSGSHIVSYWRELGKAVEKLKSIVDSYPEKAVFKDFIWSEKEIKDFSYKKLMSHCKNKNFIIEFKTSDFRISLSKGTSSYQMNIYINEG